MIVRLAVQASLLTLGLLAGTLTNSAHADQRHFTYSYEAQTLPEDTWEFEQWVTNQNGKETGDYSRWDLRSEFEYGLTNSLTTALYLNLKQVRQDGVVGSEDSNDFEFTRVSSEWIYQLLNPNLDPVGMALYGEVATDGIDYKVEGKLLFSKEIENVVLATNLIYEAEWEREDNKTEEEATFEMTFGAAYKIAPKWSLGIEARNKSAYPGGLDLSGQEFQTWSVGPNVHYGTGKWWATLTILPQVWGNGDGAVGNRQLDHEEKVETRLIFGIFL